MIIEKVNNLSICIHKKPKDITPEPFVKKFFEKKGYKVIKKNAPPGIPDFFCEKEEEKFYVEVKSENDALRISQIKWIKENYDKPTIIFVTETEIDKEPIRKEKKEVSYYCSKCYNLFPNGEITEESRKKFCYPCFRKYLFIKSYEKKNKKIPEDIKNMLYKLKKEINTNELNEMVQLN